MTPAVSCFLTHDHSIFLYTGTGRARPVSRLQGTKVLTQDIWRIDILPPPPDYCLDPGPHYWQVTSHSQVSMS